MNRVAAYKRGWQASKRTTTYDLDAAEARFIKAHGETFATDFAAGWADYASDLPYRHAYSDDGRLSGKPEPEPEPEPAYVECEWFAECHEPSTGTVEHPTLGDVEICTLHQEWLLKDYSPTKMVPPMLARHMRVEPAPAPMVPIMPTMDDQTYMDETGIYTSSDNGETFIWRLAPQTPRSGHMPWTRYTSAVIEWMTGDRG